MPILPIIKGHINEVAGKNQELFDERIAICQTCPNLTDTAYGLTCGVCGCRLQAKLRLATEKCPLDKFGVVIDTL